MKYDRPFLSISIKALSFILTIIVFGGCQILWRYTVLNFPDANDYKHFPANTIYKADTVFFFEKGKSISLDVDINYKYRGNEISKSLISLLEETETTSFLVIKDDKIVYEKYFLDYQSDEPQILFSVTKSFVSALVGIAINEGFIKSIDDPIYLYIDELTGKEEGEITIKQLLTMSSGYKYNGGEMPWSDDCNVMFTYDKRRATLKNIEKEEEPGLHNHYNNYHPVLLGMILERTTGMSVSEFFETYLWQKIQTQHNALWTLDSEKKHCEKLMSGLVMTPIDLAKFGRLYLNKGKWDDKQIIAQEWVENSTNWALEYAAHDDYYTKFNWEESLSWFEAGGYYKYGWWCYSEDDTDNVYTAEGTLGQVLHVDPQRNMIVIRTGNKWGEVDWWIDIIRTITEELYEEM